MKQGGEAFFRTAEGMLALALVGDFADDADHARLAVLVRQQAAIDFQPVQAAVGPEDAVMAGPFEKLAFQYRMKGPQGARAVLDRQQVEVVDVLGQRLVRIEAEQRLGTTGPTDLAAFNIPAPGPEASAVEGGEQLRGAFPALFRHVRVECMNAWQGRNTAGVLGHLQLSLG